jgi:hypothetical protein
VVGVQHPVLVNALALASITRQLKFVTSPVLVLVQSNSGAVR